MNHKLHRLADLLLAIEMEMRQLGLWEQNPPPPEALESLVPFCHDSLELHQWLQWLFLPRMKAMLEEEATLPNQSDITSLAEYSFQQLPHNTDELLQLLSAMDELINGAP